MNSKSRYSMGAIVLHWLIAILIILNFIAAWISDDMPKAEKMQVMANHKAFGMTILVLTLVRIGWRLAYKAPPFEASLQVWEVAVAKVVHVLFYVLMLAIPLTGWAMASVGGHPVGWFGLFSFPALPVGSDRATGGTFHEMHEVLAWAMLVLLALHIAATIKHMFFDHDGTAARISPFARR